MIKSYIIRYLKSPWSYFNKMISNLATSELLPPLDVSKMRVWQPELFNKTVEVPYIVVQEHMLNKMKKQFKSYFLKVPNFPNVQNIDQCNTSVHSEISDESLKAKRILLHPDKIKIFEDFSSEEKQLLITDYNINPEKHFGKTNIHLNYTNYSPSSMMKGNSQK